MLFPMRTHTEAKPRQVQRPTQRDCTKANGTVAWCNLRIWERNT